MVLDQLESYSKMTFTFIKNENYERENVIKGLIELQYKEMTKTFKEEHLESGGKT